MYYDYSFMIGVICSYIRCVDVTYESKREEDFYDVQLDVKGCKDIYESLRKYTAKEMLDGENQYDAGPEFNKQDAEKGGMYMKP
jgi:ubiquitin carboxyl-terminal hydrolase 7